MMKKATLRVGTVISALLFLFLAACSPGIAEDYPPYFFGVTWDLDTNRGIPVALHFVAGANWIVVCYQTHTMFGGQLVQLTTPQVAVSSTNGGSGPNVRHVYCLSRFVESTAGKTMDKCVGRFVWYLRSPASPPYSCEIQCEFTIQTYSVSATEIELNGKGSQDMIDAFSEAPVNSDSFWGNLFIAQPETLTNLQNALASYANIAPIAIIYEFRDALADQEGGIPLVDGRRLLKFGRISLPCMPDMDITLDITTGFPWLQWIRRFAGIGLWVAAALCVWKRMADRVT